MEGAKVDNIISQVTEEVTTQIVGSCTEFVGDQISPDEVITICAGMESLTDEVILSSVTRQQNAGSGNKHDWFTVKKPLKCYGRPGYSVLEPGGNITSEVTTVPSNTRPDSNINTSNGHGVYVVEYVQGQDGRLAKVYHGSASLVSRNNQQLSTYTTSADNFEGTSVSRDITSPVTTVAHAAIGSSFSGTSSTSVNNSAKLMIRGAARRC
ncbi:hypothetical protein Hamer_G009943 [Homarus americanus]|uniref:Uncharacterized protein n=1 Tax=Homarus americanus TaxID=6706 RepID=A0A8J5TIH3_HOMAM|nr:hypothetical protein Hamer_G009943 [Homarus americanus]